MRLAGGKPRPRWTRLHSASTMKAPAIELPPSYCRAAPGHPVHGPYHETEYGFPAQDESVLFERLILEINQAGLSWLTILNKRQSFRDAYHQSEVDRGLLPHRDGSPDGRPRHHPQSPEDRSGDRRAADPRPARAGSFVAWLSSHPLPRSRQAADLRHRGITGEFLLSLGTCWRARRRMPGIVPHRAARPPWSAASATARMRSRRDTPVGDPEYDAVASRTSPAAARARRGRSSTSCRTRTRTAAVAAIAEPQSRPQAEHRAWPRTRPSTPAGAAIAGAVTRRLHCGALASRAQIGAGALRSRRVAGLTCRRGRAARGRESRHAGSFGFRDRFRWCNGLARLRQRARGGLYLTAQRQAEHAGDLSATVSHASPARRVDLRQPEFAEPLRVPRRRGPALATP